MRPGAAGGVAAAAAALVLSLLLNAGLFSFLPAMAYWRQHRGQGPEDRAKETRLVALPMLPKKKEKPQSREQKQTPARKAPEPGKAVARQRFVMDLGMGGGSGAGVAAGGMAQGDLQQVEYAEGETDEDGRALSTPAPRKPKKAEAAGIGGLAEISILVDESGRVADIRILKVPAAGYGFEEAIKEAVSQWKFTPGKVSGIPVRTRWAYPIQF